MKTDAIKWHRSFKSNGIKIVDTENWDLSLKARRRAIKCMEMPQLVNKIAGGVPQFLKILMGLLRNLIFPLIYIFGSND